MSELEQQPIVEHLRELRTRLVRSLMAIFVGTCVAFYFSEILFDFLREPIRAYLPMGGLVFTAPTDKFMASLKIAVFGGVLFSCPVWLYQIWKFVAPGLYVNERRYTISFLVAGTILFLIGVSFAYFLAVPAAFHFLMTFGGDIDKPMITIDHYLGFLTTFLFMFGFAFELPLVIVLLGMMGIVSQEFLRRNRRYIVVAIAAVSAVVTPPDIMSMVLLS